MHGATIRHVVICWVLAREYSRRAEGQAYSLHEVATNRVFNPYPANVENMVSS